MYILGIDTSCDETSASILLNNTVLSNIIYSQHIHKKYGGVVPALASKNHEKNIYQVVSQALNEANIYLKDLTAIAVTSKPGLISSLLVGLNFAKGLSIGLDIPIYTINHLEGHLCSNLIGNDNIEYPYICLLVSGGHTQLWKVANENSYEIISTTVDDAAGEAFDKGAKMLGLNYPGGPEIEKKALLGNRHKYKFTLPIVKDSILSFSFSGLKTALLYKIKDMNKTKLNQEINNLSASYQEAILDSLFLKLKIIINNTNIKNISIVGGVSLNNRFRDKAKIFESNHSVNILFPDINYCTDNGAMIGMAGYLKCLNKSKQKDSLSSIPSPNINF